MRLDLGAERREVLELRLEDGEGSLCDCEEIESYFFGRVSLLVISWTYLSIRS